MDISLELYADFVAIAWYCIWVLKSSLLKAWALFESIAHLSLETGWTTVVRCPQDDLESCQIGKRGLSRQYHT